MAQTLLNRNMRTYIVCNILIVDDDKLIRWSLKELFSQEGYNVDAVSSTEEALEQVKSCSYNLIISDLIINDENCYRKIRKMASFQPKAKIIIISALNAGQIKSQFTDKSIYSIIEKPFKGEQIRSIAKKALE